MPDSSHASAHTRDQGYSLGEFPIVVVSEKQLALSLKISADEFRVGNKLFPPPPPTGRAPKTQTLSRGRGRRRFFVGSQLQEKTRVQLLEPGAVGGGGVFLALNLMP
jgi:hypothetical protein